MFRNPLCCLHVETDLYLGVDYNKEASEWAIVYTLSASKGIFMARTYGLHVC